MKTPEVMGRARVPSFSRAATSLRFSSRKTRRATWRVFASETSITLELGNGVAQLRTCDSNPVDVIRDNALPFDDIVELRTSAMENDWVESHAVQETQAQRKLVKLFQDRTADLDDGEFCWVGWVRRC